MRRVTHTDRQGRKTLVEIPNDAPAENAAYGVRVGPPCLKDLNLPRDIEIRLHNQLYDRGLLGAKDVKGKTQEVFAALQAAFRVDTVTILNLYSE